MRATLDEIHRLHASVCKGLGDPKRLLIINLLRDGERTTSEICQELGFSQANISQHLGILRSKGLIKSRKEGQRVYHSLASPKIAEAMDLMREVLDESLGALVHTVR